MKIIRLQEAERYEPEANWQRISLCQEQAISIEQFVKAAQHTSPFHHHSNAQVLILVTGKLLVHLENGVTEELNSGDVAFIPGNEAHSVTNPLDEPASGFDIFVPGRSFDFWRNRLST